MRMTEYNLLWQKEGMDEMREIDIDLFKLD